MCCLGAQRGCAEAKAHEDRQGSLKRRDFFRRQAQGHRGAVESTCYNKAR